MKTSNGRVVDATFTPEGVRPHRGDTRKSGISEFGRISLPTAKNASAVTTSHAPKILTFDSTLTWRKLTPLECERLQTVPDNYTDHVSNTQRYKMLGNGWTVDVIAHIFKNLKEPKI